MVDPTPQFCLGGTLANVKDSFEVQVHDQATMSQIQSVPNLKLQKGNAFSQLLKYGNKKHLSSSKTVESNTQYPAT